VRTFCQLLLPQNDVTTFGFLKLALQLVERRLLLRCCLVGVG
jgi:hypothetical protein